MVIPCRSGNVEQADERLEAGRQRRAFDRFAADRDSADRRRSPEVPRELPPSGSTPSCRRTCTRGCPRPADRRRGRRGLPASAGSAHAFRCRASRSGIRRARVLRVRRLDHVVLQVRVEPVLRTEERREGEVRAGREQVRGVTQFGVDRRGIADEADARPRRRSEASSRSRPMSTGIGRVSHKRNPGRQRRPGRLCRRAIRPNYLRLPDQPGEAHEAGADQQQRGRLGHVSDPGGRHLRLREEHVGAGRAQRREVEHRAPAAQVGRQLQRHVTRQASRCCASAT